MKKPHAFKLAGRPWLVLALLFVLVAPMAVIADVPADLDARRAEMKELQDYTDTWKGRVGPRINEVIAHLPSFLPAHEAVQAVDLTDDERYALKRQGLDALSPEKAAVFRQAGPVFVEMRNRMTLYFNAYDRYMRGELKLHGFGTIVSALERLEGLEGKLNALRRRRVKKKLEKAYKYEKIFRDALADPAVINHEWTNPGRKLFFAADDADEYLALMESKYGLADKRPLGAPVGKFFRKLKEYARTGKNYAATLPASARLAAYLYNPFRKKPDPEKASKLLRHFSKSYRKAAGLKLTVKGQENVPKNVPCVFALSHRSGIEDACAMMAVVPGKYAFMVAQRALPGFLNDKLVKDPNVINVGGKKPDGTKVNAIEDGIAAIENDMHLAVFPEGSTPTQQEETRPLRQGIDIICDAVSDHPIYIIPVTIDDPAAGYDEPRYLSHHQKIDVTVTLGKPIDPLKFKAVPGAGRRMLLNVIRAFWHRGLYRKDVSFDTGSEEEIGTLTGGRDESFDRLYGQED